jgi:hypothetical protein
MIRYDYLCDDAFGTTSLDPLVVSRIGITMTRDSEDDRLLEVIAHDFQSLFNTFDIMTMPGGVASRKQRPISHGSLKLLRATSF